jgi:hypothetical protein
MWLIHLIPTSILSFAVNFVLLAGVVGTIASFFITLPKYTLHRILVQVVAIPLVVLGVYWKGGLAIEQSWREKVAELEEKVKIAESKSQQTNKEIEYIIQEKVRVVKDTQVVIQEKIRDVSVNIDANCKITTETVDILNSAARNVVPGAKR